jgi:tetratricopeptide (TPR) repeat protein
MFKLFQNMMGGDDELTNINGNSLESFPDSYSNSLSLNNNVDTSEDKAELIWQQGNLQKAINLYEGTVKESPSSYKAYQQLLSHLKQQNSVADAYKLLAESLKKQGKNEEAAICYRQAVIIQAVTNEVEEKYKKAISTLSRSPAKASQADIVNLEDSAFSFQGAIKKATLETKPNLLQVEIPEEYIPKLGETLNNKNLDSHRIATIEWEAAQSFMEKALDCCDREEWLEVTQACQQATRIMPEMAEAYKIWGNALQRMNRTAEAMECYSKAVEIQPDLAEVYAGIAKLYAQQQKWQQAIEYFQKAIIIKPDFALAYQNLAGVWEQLGEAEKAQVCYDRAQEIQAKQTATSEEQDKNSLNSQAKPTNISREMVERSVLTYQKLGQDSEKQNLWHEAAVYYRKALEMNLTQTQNLIAPEVISENKQNQANQFNRLQKIQELIQDKSSNEAYKFFTSQNQEVGKSNTPVNQREVLAPIEDSQRKNKQKTDTTANQENYIDQAIGLYSRKAKLQPNSASIQLDLGNLYAKKAKWSSAIACYNKALRINPQEAKAHLNLAKISAKTGDQSQYTEHLYMAYTIKPDLGSAEEHFLLGEALKKGGNRTRAIHCYQQAIKLQPHFNDAYRRLGQLFQEIGQSTNAIASYQAAIRHHPQDADFHFSLGELLEKQGAWDGAVKAYRRVLELQPKYPQAPQKLNRALSEKLKQDLAVRAYKN